MKLGTKYRNHSPYMAIAVMQKKTIENKTNNTAIKKKNAR